MNGETGFLHSFGVWSVLSVGLLRSEGSSPLGRIFVPQTSHEGGWRQASIALPIESCSVASFGLARPYSLIGECS